MTTPRLGGARGLFLAYAAGREHVTHVWIEGRARLAGRLIPGVAILFNAVGNERRTRVLADRAIRFYGG